MSWIRDESENPHVRNVEIGVPSESVANWTIVCLKEILIGGGIPGCDGVPSFAPAVASGYVSVEIRCGRSGVSDESHRALVGLVGLDTHVLGVLSRIDGGARLGDDAGIGLCRQR